MKIRGIHKIFLDRNISGFSLVETIVGVAFLGIMLAAAMRFFGDSSNQYIQAKNKHIDTALEHYLLGFPDCGATAADPKFDLNCQSNKSINIYDDAGRVIVPESGRKFGSKLVTAKCDKGLVTFYSKADAKGAQDAPLYSGIPWPCYDKPSGSCSGFTVKWSNTSHGKCDYSVAGSGRKVVISDGVSTFESTSMSGTMPCNPWNGRNGDLSFDVSVFGSSGVPTSCPKKILRCNPRVVHLKAGLAPQTEYVDITDDGLTHRKTIYRHWLYLTVGLIASWGPSSAVIGPLTVNKASCARFCGVGLTLGSSASYGAPISRYFEIDAIQRTYSTSPARAPGKASTPIFGKNIPVKWIGFDDPKDGSGPGLGVYLSQCTNNRFPSTPRYWNYPASTFFSLLKP